jgi:hypothetical protein
MDHIPHHKPDSSPKQSDVQAVRESDEPPKTVHAPVKRKAVMMAVQRQRTMRSTRVHAIIEIDCQYHPKATAIKNNSIPTSLDSLIFCETQEKADLIFPCITCGSDIPSKDDDT